MPKTTIILVAAVAIILLIGAALLLTFLFAGLEFTPLGSVAIIPVKGEITDDKPYLDATFTSSEVVDKIYEAEFDPMVSAIVLDIDSPGGGVVATKQIVYAVRDTEKPVVAYIGETGASGGYYVAASSDYIVADADSLTGSIGVISIVMNIKELLEDYGVTVSVLKEGEFKGIGNMFEDFNESERAILQEILRGAYTRFKSDILEFRTGRVRPMQFEAVADGRILSGEQALKAGLIDELGTKQAAIDMAGEMAGIGPNPPVRYFGKEEPTFMDMLTASGYYFGIGLKQGMDQAMRASPEIRV